MNDELDLEESGFWWALVLMVIGGALRVLMLGQKGMWLDETISVWMANHEVAELLQWTVRIDQHPPLYYLLLHYWILLVGDAPYGVRLLSALLGAATIPIVYLIGKRISGAGVGLAAALFFAFSPFLLYFAQETRMYTLLTFNAAVAIYALVRLLTDASTARPIGSQLRAYWRTWRTARPVESGTAGAFSYQVELPQTGWRAWRYRHPRPPTRMIETDLAWIALILFSAATMLSHNTAVLFTVAVNLYVFGLMLYQRVSHTGAAPAFQAPALKNWVIAQLVIVLLWLPWAYFFIMQAGAVYQRFWIPEPTWEIVLHVLRSFFGAAAPMVIGQTVVLWSLYALLLVLSVVHFRSKLSRLLFLVVLFAVPFLGELLVSIVRPIFFNRTLIWITIPLFLVLGAGIAQLKHRFVIIVTAGILVAANLFTIGDYFRFFQKEDWSTPAGYVANFAEAGDLVLFNSNFTVIPFDYYFKPFEELYSIEVEKQGVPLDLFKDGVPEPEMTVREIPALISLLEGHDRVWLVYSHDSYTDPVGIIPNTLASQMTLTRQRDFYGGQVHLYERK